MDSDILKIEEIVMGGGEAAAPAELPPEKTEDAYTTSIQDRAPPPIIQSCECEGKSLILYWNQLWKDVLQLLNVFLIGTCCIVLYQFSNSVMVNGVLAYLFKIWDRIINF